MIVLPKTFGKIETAKAIFWIWYGLKNYFFRNKTFLFFKIECWNFQVQFEIEFHETSHNFNSISLAYSDNCYFYLFLSVVWLSWNLARVHITQFQTEPESFSFLSWKTKKFYSYLKKKFLSRCQFQNKKALFTISIFPKVLILPIMWDATFWLLSNHSCIPWWQILTF